MRRLDVGTTVRIRRPGRLDGLAATVMRPASGGYELTFFLHGRPWHATVHPRWLRPISASSTSAAPADRGAADAEG